MKKEDKKIIFFWIPVSVVCTAFLGFSIISAKILFFNSDETGKYTSQQECVMWNNDCINACSDNYGSIYSSSCPDCCINYQSFKVPIKDKIITDGKLAIIIGAIIGGFIGYIKSATEIERRNKRN